MLVRYTNAIKTIATTVAISGLMIVSLSSCAAQDTETKNVDKSSGKNSSSVEGNKKSDEKENLKNDASDYKKSDADACEYLSVEFALVTTQERTEATEQANTVMMLNKINAIMDETQKLAVDANFIEDINTFTASSTEVIDYINSNENLDAATDTEYQTLLNDALDNIAPFDEFCATAIKG